MLEDVHAKMVSMKTQTINVRAVILLVEPVQMITHAIHAFLQRTKLLALLACVNVLIPQYITPPYKLVKPATTSVLHVK